MIHLILSSEKSHGRVRHCCRISGYHMFGVWGRARLHPGDLLKRYFTEKSWETILCIFDSITSSSVINSQCWFYSGGENDQQISPLWCIFSPSRVSMEHLARVNTGPQWATINYISDKLDRHTATRPHFITIWRMLPGYFPPISPACSFALSKW